MALKPWLQIHHSSGPWASSSRQPGSVWSRSRGASWTEVAKQGQARQSSQSRTLSPHLFATARQMHYMEAKLDQVECSWCPKSGKPEMQFAGDKTQREYFSALV